ncbi:hypothetical protein BT96DRAFT_949866 [Gymnopus androsaceus JB14]|uniref:Uncharacterized protein n=1 Tax=Gymnopus androsaceus JB14 TaxID=1447944 RepID=A0A6A4GJ70_9AGAR|nr:hypothetical protein BT96DRAFT_949866 [Gymnopus androsaceus JB14]
MSKGETTPPPDTKPSRKRAGRESSLTDEQQAIVESFFPAWEQLLRQHKLHLGKGNNSKTRDPEAVTTWINKTLKEIRGTKETRIIGFILESTPPLLLSNTTLEVLYPSTISVKLDAFSAVVLGLTR